MNQKPILSGPNAEAFGCATCEHRRNDLCWHDRHLPRPIQTWGYCPKTEQPGPVRAWERSHIKFRSR
jgi:hypothetical protein